MSRISHELIISKAGEPSRVLPLHEGEYRIGRSRSCEILLEHISVSSQHALLTLKGDSVMLEDRGSTNGTYVDEVRLSRPIELNGRHVVRLGEYHLQLKLSVPKTEPSFQNVSTLPSQIVPIDPLEELRPPSVFFEQVAPSPSLEPSWDAPFTEEQKQKRELYRKVRQEVHQELFKRLDLKRLATTELKDDGLSAKARKTIDEIIEKLGDKIPKNLSRGQLAKDVYDEAIGLGPLEPLLVDPEITEIMVNGASSIYYEKRGRLILSESQFLDDQQLMAIIERILAPAGRRIDESQPMADVRLKDGSRVNAIMPPLSLKGPCVTIRKFSKKPYKISNLIAFESLTSQMGEFFKKCVQLRKNILISGGTGCGKTTLLNILADFLPPTERIITIEDVAELRLNQHHVLSLEARAPNMEGKGGVTVRDLVRNALRMRSDRIILGECRGEEALDILQAMNMGHDGSLMTVHAHSTRDALSRLEMMFLMARMDSPAHAIRKQIASAIHIIIQQDRFSDGTRKITRVSEIVGTEHDSITVQDLFRHVQTGMDAQGAVQGYFTATGCMPTFMEEIKARGLDLDPRIFDRNQREAAA